ncbi:MAG: GntR family transcriptional regulator [Solirubrobacterales bacterium]|nr:GntR family transcriptional regulator [Solirubrobacterales bacterium]HMT04170.1 GntR family transcriptional regulator [Solirubrobacterales bacterium]
MTENLPDIGVRVSPVSTVEAAANALRELILDGNLEPGVRLREHDFAERLGIARHSFRAATQILIGEGLLKREPHRGVEVAILAADDVADIFRLREALEIEAVRIVTAAGVVPAEAHRAVTEMSALSDDAPWRDVVWPDQRFHRAIIDATNSPRLARAYQGLQSEITLCLAQLRPVYDAPAEVAAEHEELLGPIISGDVELAEKLFRAHLAEAAENLIGLHQERNQEADPGA